MQAIKGRAGTIMMNAKAPEGRAQLNLRNMFYFVLEDLIINQIVFYFCF